jgi:hypothetical protein
VRSTSCCVCSSTLTLYTSCTPTHRSIQVSHPKIVCTQSIRPCVSSLLDWSQCIDMIDRAPCCRVGSARATPTAWYGRAGGRSAATHSGIERFNLVPLTLHLEARCRLLNHHVLSSMCTCPSVALSAYNISTLRIYGAHVEAGDEQVRLHPHTPETSMIRQNVRGQIHGGYWGFSLQTTKEYI